MKKDVEMTTAKAYMAVFSLPVLAGFDFVFIEYMTGVLDAVNVAGIRTIIAALFFLPLHYVLQGKMNIEKSDLPRFLLAGGICVGFYYVLEAIGIAMISAALSSIILSIVPIHTILIDRIFMGKSITRMKMIGSAASIAGVAIIVYGSMDTELGGSVLGIVVLLIATVLWAVYIAVSKPLSEKYSPLTVTTGEFLAGAAVMVPLILLYKPEEFLALSPTHAVLMVVFAVIGIAMANLLYMYGIKGLPVIIPSVAINLIPFMTILVSWFVLHSVPTGVQLLGGAIVVASVFLSSLDREE